jgi:hypothetical protein
MTNSDTAHRRETDCSPTARRAFPRKAALLCMMLLAASAVSVRGATDELERRASWSPPTSDQVRQQLFDWVDEQQADDAARLGVEALWPPEEDSVESGELLHKLTVAIAAVDERVREVVAVSQRPRQSVLLPSYDFLDDETTAALVRNNVKLLYGRWLAQQSFYDEAFEQLDGLDAEDVCDPAALLFYQSVTYHRLLEKDKCLETLTRLLENEDRIPRRYLILARLMKADMAPLKTDTLDEVARLMDDIRRRLGLYRAGARVRNQEDEVIAKLDKMIEELEQQQQQQQQQQNTGRMRPSQPMPDSMPGGGKGPGNVDPSRLGVKSGWGSLPPKEREKALQQIGKDLPAHYREVIEEYFRKLARDSGG